MKRDKTYSIDFYSSLTDNRKNWREIRQAMRIVEKAFLWADKKLRRSISHMLSAYPNNYHNKALQVSVNVDKEDIGPCGGVYCPEDNEIVINKYVRPINERKEAAVLDLTKDKNLLQHIVLHELIHYAFTEYEYFDSNEKPVSWTVGLCTQENTTSHIEKEHDKKWKVDEWLDEVLTERLAMHLSGRTKVGTLLYEKNISDNDKPTFEKVKNKLINGPVVFEEMIEALYYHDKSRFLKD